MSRTVFIIVVIVILAGLAYYVWSERERADNSENEAKGPPNPHSTEDTYSDCLDCHSDITDSHDDKFGAGNYDDCLSCHEPAG